MRSIAIILLCLPAVIIASTEDCHDNLNKNPVYKDLCCKEDNKKCRLCTGHNHCDGDDNKDEDCEYHGDYCNDEKDCENSSNMVVEKSISPPVFSYPWDWST